MFVILFAISCLKIAFYSVNPHFHYIRSENMPFQAKISTLMSVILARNWTIIH